MLFRKKNPTPRTVLFLLAVGAGMDSVAAQYIVTKTTDSFDGKCDSDCSLREAIEEANKASGTHSIHLPAGDYALTLPSPDEQDDDMDLDTSNSMGDFDIHSELTISGAKDGATIINAMAKNRHFTIYQTGSLTLKHLQLINGFTSFHGGSIFNTGYVQIENSILRNNIATSYWHRNYGGAIYNSGTLKIQRAEFLNNIALAGNEDYSFGGAIYNFNTLYIRDSAFRNNHAKTDGPLGLGGAIYNYSSADIGRAVFSSNSAKGGGMAFHNSGSATLSNTTISNNYGDPSLFAGALQNENKVTLINSSIVGNTPGAGFHNSGEAHIRNSIILNNNGATPVNCYNRYRFYPFKTRGLLLGGGNTQCTGDIYVADSDTFTHVLAPLAQNDYPLESHALLPGSPAIDAGVGSCSTHDQRWQHRPIDGNNDGIALCDLGSFERQLHDE